MRWDFRGCWLSIYKGRNSPASVLHEAWGAPDLVTTLLFDYTKPNPRIFPLTMPSPPGSTGASLGLAIPWGVTLHPPKTQGPQSHPSPSDCRG